MGRKRIWVYLWCLISYYHDYDLNYRTLERWATEREKFLFSRFNWTPTHRWPPFLFLSLFLIAFPRAGFVCITNFVWLPADIFFPDFSRSKWLKLNLIQSKFDQPLIVLHSFANLILTFFFTFTACVIITKKFVWKGWKCFSAVILNFQFAFSQGQQQDKHPKSPLSLFLLL